MRAPYFFEQPVPGRNQWWTYFVTILLVFSGIIGFGNLPLYAALNANGILTEDISVYSVQELEAILGRNLLFTLNLFPFVIGFFMLLIAFRFVHHRPVLSYFTIRPAFDLKRFLIGFWISGILLGTLFGVGMLIDDQNLVWNFNPEKFFVLLLICIFIIPIQTGFEELLFRGYLLQLFGRATSKGLIIILVNGLLFGLLHGMNPEMDKLGWFAMVFYVLSGVFAALITVMDDGIELSWGFHTANNFMGVLIVTSDWQVFRTDALYVDVSQPGIGADMYINLFVCYPLLIFLFSKIYKWTSWKKRLLGK